MRSQSNLQVAGGWVSRLLRLDFSAFEDIKRERLATVHAVGVVLGASVLAGFGSWIWGLQHTDFQAVSGSEMFLKSLVGGSIVQTGVWFLWVYLVFYVLGRGYGVQVPFQDLVRTMGFAFAPVGFSILVAIASLAVPFGVIAFVFAFLLTNIAIQYAADIEVREATLANLTGFTAFAIVMGIFANIAEVGTFGGLAPGLFFFSLDL
jgi:hypothetical protein